MANRQIISVGEREALAAESTYWQAMERYLIKDSGQREGNFMLIQASEGPVPPHIQNHGEDEPLLQQLWHDSLNDIRKRDLVGNFHWGALYQVDQRFYALFASSNPVSIKLDEQLQAEIRGVFSIEEAKERLDAFALAQKAMDSGWDFAFHNRSIGKPNPWTWVNGIKLDQATDYGVAADMLLRFLDVSRADGILTLKHWFAENAIHPAEYCIAKADHAAFRDDLIQRLVYIHTCRSMWLRTIPRQIGQRHVTANDAPTYGGIRPRIILRIKQLWPKAHEACRHFLPTSTQRKLQQAVIEASIPRGAFQTGTTIETLREEDMQPRNQNRSKPRIKVNPDDLKELDQTFFGYSEEDDNG